MCGIVGGISERNILPILVEGLSRLEYRGYDSAGVAFKKNGSISVTKNLGRVNQLTKKLNLKNKPKQFRNSPHKVGNSWHSF